MLTGWVPAPLACSLAPLCVLVVVDGVSHSVICSQEVFVPLSASLKEIFLTIHDRFFLLVIVLFFQPPL